MKISSTNKRIGKNFTTPNNRITKNKDFSTALNMSKKQQQDYQIKQMLKKIKKAGEKVKETLSVVDVNIYKEYIRDFLNYVLNNSYSISHVHRYHGILSNVKVINDELENLAQEVLAEQKNNIAIAKKIDNILGLLFDVHT